MIKKSPLVSICVPTYNNARYLRECLDSIVSQTYTNMELIVGDDGSTDDTVSIVQEYVDRYGIHFHKNHKNLGGGATSSILVSMARGEYVAVYHSDDRYKPTIVEESVNILNNDASLGLVSCLANIIDDQGKNSGEFRLHNIIKNLNKRSYSFDDVIRGILKNAGKDIMLVTPSIMARKQIYQEMGLYRPDKYKSAYDYEMWLRIATRYNVAILEKNLMDYRIHENQISELQIRKNIEIQNIVWVLRDYREFISDSMLKKDCNRLLDKWIFRAAKKQNYRGYYQKSSETLRLIGSRKYLFLAWLLRGLNYLNVSLKRRTV